MYKLLLPTLIFTALHLAQAQPQNLPATPKRPVSDTYFGKTIVDNYRWLEDMNSPETKAWFKAQGDYTNAVLDQIPGCDKLIDTFVDYDKLRSVRYGEISKRGNGDNVRYFYRKTLTAEKVGRLYTRDGKTGAETLLFDPSAYDKRKTYSVTAFTPSPDGQQVVIGLQEGGAELSTMRTMAVATKSFQPESITAVSGGGIAWLPDNSGYLYTPQNSADTKDPKGNLDTKGRLHRLGTDPQTDPDLLSRAKNPDMGIRPDHYPIMYFSDDDTQVYGYLASVDRRVDAWVASPADLTKPAIGWKRLAAPTDSVYNFLKLGNRLYLHSVKGSPNGQILITGQSEPRHGHRALSRRQAEHHRHQFDKRLSVRDPQ